MTIQHTLIIRGIDDESHSRLGELANQRGVSINSIVRDAIDKWLKKQSDTPRKHYLVIYSDDDSLVQLLKPIDSLAREAGLVRCFCGPPDSLITKHLGRLNWYNGTVEPYLEPSNRNVTKYFDGLMKNITMNADNKQVCCMDFVINDLANSYLKQALNIEHVYEDSRITGLMYCMYKTPTLLNLEIKDMMELFEMHDQIFILDEHEVYKLHVTKENVHKLFLH